MYTKIHWITCNPKQSASFIEHYDSTIVPMIKNCAYHKGHQLIKLRDGEWVLISNYHTRSGANASATMIETLFDKIGDKFHESELEYITQGEVIRYFGLEDQGRRDFKIESISASRLV